MIKDNYIRAAFPWPEVRGERVPIVARRYKLMIMTFAGAGIAIATYALFRVLHS